MMRTSLSRWQAFGIHLLMSLAVFFVIVFVLARYWYPGVFLNAGGWSGIKIVAAVDLILGPLLTLIVFNPNKKSLKWDLSAIGLLQISCLGYGIWVVESQRPISQVLLDDSLYIITKADYKEFGINTEFLKDYEGPWPKKVMLNLPNNHTVIATTLVKEAFTGKPLEYHTDLYIDISQAHTQPEFQNRLQWQLERLEKADTGECYWLLVYSPHFDQQFCFSTTEGAIKKRQTPEKALDAPYDLPPEEHHFESPAKTEAPPPSPAQ